MKYQLLRCAILIGYIISLFLFCMPSSSSTAESLSPMQIRIKTILANAYGNSFNMVYEVYEPRQYSTFYIQCVGIRDNFKPLAGRLYYTFLIDDKNQIGWYYKLGYIDREPENNRTYYRECSYKKS